MANTTSNRRFLPSICIVMWIYFVHHSPWYVRIWPGNMRSVNKGTSFLGDRKLAGFVSLSMQFNQHCGAIYLRSKLYLVFKISSDIMTKHCCQVCVLSMMFCHSDSLLCADMVSDGAIGKLWVPRGLTTLWQANVGNDMKNILFIWFSHFTLTETQRIIPCCCISIKTKIIPCLPIYWQHRNRL